MSLAVPPITDSYFDVTKRPDALQAVKLDPAVLEAQITVDTQHDETTSESSEAAKQTAKQPAEECNAPPKLTKFEDMMKKQKAALLSLAPQQFELLLKYAEILRLQRAFNQKYLECAFCKNNGEPASWYSLHKLKDKRGRVRCPVLRVYRCPMCGATGDFAHTLKYCPKKDRDSWSC